MFPVPDAFVGGFPLGSGHIGLAKKEGQTCSLHVAGQKRKLWLCSPWTDRARVDKQNLKENDMAGIFKDRFSHESLYKLALEIQAVYAVFPVEEFLNATMDTT